MWHWNYFLRQVDKIKAEYNGKKAKIDAAYQLSTDFKETDKELVKELAKPMAEKQKVEDLVNAKEYGKLDLGLAKTIGDYR